MQSPETAALAPEHRAECAALLGLRYERQRAAEPLLPEIEDFEPHVPDAGVVAIRGGKLVAFVAGEVKDGVGTVGFGATSTIEPA